MVRKTLFHFLRSYSALLLTVVLLLLPFYWQTFSLFEARQLSLTRQTLQEGMNRLDQQLTALNGIAFSIGQAADYRSYGNLSPASMTPAHYYNLTALHDDFRRLCISQPYVTDYSLLLKNEILFTKEQIHFPGDDYYGRFLAYGELTREEFLQTFGRPDSVTQFLPEMTVYHNAGGSEESYPAVIWLCSMSPSRVYQPSGVFFAAVSQQTLIGLLTPGFPASDAGFCLYDREGALLMQYGLAPAAQTRTHRLEAAATQSGLTATLYLSDSLFTRMMQPVRLLIRRCLELLVLLGFLCAVVLAVRASRPVVRLLRLIGRTGHGADGASEAKNSYALIGNTITELHSSLNRSRSALASQQRSIREHVFEALLRETPIPESSVSRRHIEEFQHCFPSFPARYRLSLIALRATALDDAPLETLPRQRIAVSQWIEAHFSPRPYLYLQGHHLVLALDADASADWVAALTRLKRAAQSEMKLSLLVALSEPGEGCEQLHALCQQARGLLSFAEAEKEESPVEVWERKHFPDQPPAFPFGYTEMAQLHALLSQAEKEAADALLQSVFQSLRSATFLDEVVTRQVFYNIHSVLLRVKSERYDQLISLDIPDYHGELSDSALFARLSQCCRQACDLLAPAVGSRRNQFAAAVCRYIDEHIGDSALGASAVADHFGISEPTLQKVIRQAAHCSFFAYVEQKRYALAVSLLRDTRLPIARVAAQCGFNSLNSFYKAFKHNSSVTPAALRQQTLPGERKE